ncbi:conjugal transfer protein TrbL family protein [Phytohabitans houttuyneae]|uniref:TrbL/VirB6 plasmid conjugal transfer protein n=1 Tax=Phytohabitans houttuyneae TaxID=1076126 RepID=A0A6V8KA90_9ACTN|nr:conjugal transfer protein TrbL family protein [Phytohabitans houttuyneae]GFJ82133.1 hypothetical protein Phou_063130 [Phytohabitans houttuyneae]
MKGWLVDQIIEGVLSWFAAAVLGAVNALWDLLSGTVFVSPDVTALPQVQHFADTSLGIVNAGYVLAFLWTGLLVIGRGTIHTTYGPGELVPRLVVGLIGANFAVPLVSALIGLANAVTAALTGQDITAPESMQHLRSTTTTALDVQDVTAPAAVLLLAVGLLIAVLSGALIVQWIVRIGVLIVAAGLAPIALALHGTPQTEGAAKLWWRTLLAALGTVVAQAVALDTTLTIFLSPQANLPTLGLPGDPGAVMNLFVVLCLLWAVVKIPTLMRRYVTRGGGSNPLGMILRVMVVQQLTRRMSGRRRSAHPGARSGPGAAGTAGATRSWPVRPVSSRSQSGTTGRRAPRPSGSLPLPPPSGAGPGRVGVAYPSGRVVRPYTAQQLRAGVDLYTQVARNRAASSRKATP